MIAGFLTRRVVLAVLGGLVLAGGGVAAATVLTSSSGPATLTVCATATVDEQTVGVNGAPIHTVPGAGDEQCATTTVPTVTETIAGGGPPTTTATTTPPPATTSPPPTTVPPETTTPPATTSAGEGVANVWVDDGTGSCKRSTAPAAYDSATACKTFDAAYHAAGDGDLVLVLDGSYGQQKFTTRGTSGWTSGVTFRAETPLQVTVEADTGTSLALGSADWVTLDGFKIDSPCAQSQTGCTATGFGAINDGTSTSDVSKHVTFLNDDIDVGAYTGGGIVTLHTADYWTFRDDTFGPSCCGLRPDGGGSSPVPISVGKPNSLAAACGTTEACHLVIDHNLFQYTSREANFWPATWPRPPGLTSCPNSAGCHMDTIHIWSAMHVELTNNRIYGADCNGILLQENSNALMADYTITGNAISKTNESCNGALGINMIGPPGSWAGTWKIGFNSLAAPLNVIVGANTLAPGSTLDFYGNYSNPVYRTFREADGTDKGGTDCLYMDKTGPPANLKITYSHNVWRGGVACSPTDQIATSPDFINSAAAPATGIDMQLAAGSGPPAGGITCSALTVGACPAGTDAFGNPWPAPKANAAGADQAP